MLTFSLGSAPSLFRLSRRGEHVAYKQQYENFKLRSTAVALGLSLVNCVLLDWVWLDKISQVLTVGVDGWVGGRE